MIAALGITRLLAIFAAIGLGAVLQGSVGYGMALLASPILILIEPRLIPGPYLLASLSLNLLVLLRERKSIDLRGMAWALVGRVPGTVLAGYLLYVVSQRSMVFLFGGLLLFGVAISAAGVHWAPRPRNLLLAGLLSGVMETMATIGGPPMAMVYQDASSERLRSTLSAYFLIGSLFSLVTLLAIGRMGVVEVQLSLLLLPGILLGYLISSKIVPLLKGRSIRGAVLTVAAISGIVIIVQRVLS